MHTPHSMLNHAYLSTNPVHFDWQKGDPSRSTHPAPHSIQTVDTLYRFKSHSTAYLCRNVTDTGSFRAYGIWLGLARTIYIRYIYTVFLAGKSSNIQLYTVYIYGSGQPYIWLTSRAKIRSQLHALPFSHPMLTHTHTIRPPNHMTFASLLMQAVAGPPAMRAGVSASAASSVAPLTTVSSHLPQAMMLLQEPPPLVRHALGVGLARAYCLCDVCVPCIPYIYIYVYLYTVYMYTVYMYVYLYTVYICV